MAGHGFTKRWCHLGLGDGETTLTLDFVVLYGGLFFKNWDFKDGRIRFDGFITATARNTSRAEKVQEVQMVVDPLDSVLQSYHYRDGDSVRLFDLHGIEYRERPFAEAFIGEGL